jgi:hypothetical protein
LGAFVVIERDQEPRSSGFDAVVSECFGPQPARNRMASVHCIERGRMRIGDSWWWRVGE